MAAGTSRMTPQSTRLTNSKTPAEASGGDRRRTTTTTTTPGTTPGTTTRATLSRGGVGGHAAANKGAVVDGAAQEQTGNSAQKDTKRRRVRAMDQRVSPSQARKSASENYEEPVTDREGWWRCYIRETPNPGAYEPGHFLDDVLRRQNTYSFKSDGRRLEPQPQIGKGEYLLPGAYDHEDFLKRFERSHTTYGFKATDRSKRDFLNFGKKDKDINVCPTAYRVEKYGSLSVEKQPSRWAVTSDGNIVELENDERHWQFKSQSQRFPTVYFKPKTGPAPGNYEYLPPNPEKVVKSAFLSKTPRFASSHTKVPGPGAYEKTFQAPMPKTIMKMGRNHGLFFSSAFQA